MTTRTNPVAKYYDLLTPEERLSLIMNAYVRGDEAERRRLADSAGSLTLTVKDHMPPAEALSEVGQAIFLELLELAAQYVGALCYSAEEHGPVAEGDNEDEDAEPADQEVTEPIEPADDDEPATADRWIDLVLATGFWLKLKASAWELFCERKNFPPWARWKLLPGYDRLERALTTAERAAFVPKGMVVFLNRVRPAGHPEVTEADLISADKIADGIEALFRERTEWWGG